MPSREELLRQYEDDKRVWPLATMRQDALALEPIAAAAGVRSVFELGSGDCGLLAELDARGRQVTGYEPSSKANTADGADVSCYPSFDESMPGIPDGHYDMAMAVGALDRLEDQEAGKRVIAELFRVARLYVILGLELPGRLGAADAFVEEAVRLGRISHERRHETARVLLLEKRQP